MGRPGGREMKSGGQEKAVGDWGSELGPGAGDTSLRKPQPSASQHLLPVSSLGWGPGLGTPSWSSHSQPLSKHTLNSTPRPHPAPPPLHPTTLTHKHTHILSQAKSGPQNPLPGDPA